MSQCTFGQSAGTIPGTALIFPLNTAAFVKQRLMTFSADIIDRRLLTEMIRVISVVLSLQYHLLEVQVCIYWMKYVNM